MSDFSISGPTPSESNSGGADSENACNQAGGTRRQRRKAPILDVETCLSALSQLPGLIACGVLKPAAANAIRASYSEILAYHHQNRQREDRQGLSNSDLLQVMRASPEVLSMLEPLLTDEQIAMLMNDRPEDDRA